MTAPSKLQTLEPASELARKNGVRFPNESSGYRRARDALLAEEIELRRHIERVAEQRRALPPGGKVAKDLPLRTRKRPGKFRGPVWRQTNPCHLQLHVRAKA